MLVCITFSTICFHFLITNVMELLQNVLQTVHPLLPLLLLLIITNVISSPSDI